MSYLEQDPQDVLISLVGSITTVERDGSKVQYYVGDNKREIDYGSSANAQAAVDEFLAAANAVPPKSGLQKGDEVSILAPDSLAATVGRTVIITELRTDKNPYWELQSVDTGNKYVVTQDVLFRISED